MTATDVTVLEPLPGDPAQISSMSSDVGGARSWTSRAAEVLSDQPVHGTGRSADALRTQREEIMLAAADLAQRSDAVERALAEFAERLTRLQERIADAQSRYTAAMEEHRHQLDRQRELESRADSLDEAGSPSSSSSSLRAQAAEAAAAAARAWADAEQARAEIAALREEWDGAGHDLAGVVSAAMPMAVSAAPGVAGTWIAHLLFPFTSALAGTWATGMPTLPTAPGRGEYVLGPPQRPEIAWDEDFEYDSDDPTVADWAARAKWLALLNGGRVIAPHLSDATAAYGHYWSNTGDHYTFDYEAAYRDDSAVELAVNNEIDRARAAVEQFIDEGERDFSFTGGPEPTSGEEYPVTENWQKAIGGHQVWSSGDVTVDGDRITMTVVVHAEDYYNFNRGQSDIATGASDDENGRFTEVGWARPFEQSGSVTRTVTWDRGSSEPPQMQGEPDAGRGGGS